jgi:hypothetical protein
MPAAVHAGRDADDQVASRRVASPLSDEARQISAVRQNHGRHTEADRHSQRQAEEDHPHVTLLALQAGALAVSRSPVPGLFHIMGDDERRCALSP